MRSKANRTRTESPSKEVSHEAPLDLKASPRGPPHSQNHGDRAVEPLPAARYLPAGAWSLLHRCDGGGVHTVGGQ